MLKTEDILLLLSIIQVIYLTVFVSNDYFYLEKNGFGLVLKCEIDKTFECGEIRKKVGKI